jgi:hypothetical protein
MDNMLIGYRANALFGTGAVTDPAEDVREEKI